MIVLQNRPIRSTSFSFLMAVLFLLLALPTDAFTTYVTSKHNIGYRYIKSMKMALESPPRRFPLSLPKFFRHPTLRHRTWKTPINTSFQPKFSHGMPWKSSISSDYNKQNKELLYMPFFDWQVDYMQRHLTNLKQLPVCNRQGRDMSYKENREKTIRIHTSQFASDEYKLIRLTVVDAGTRLQVFTSLWYPRPEINLPVLGIDLLMFNNFKKHLCICDFQSIQEDETHHAATYENLLKPIRDAHPLLQEKMTPRFYDENQFFSNQILLGRAGAEDDADEMLRQMTTAVQQYTQVHVDLVKSTLPQDNILHRHQAYDVYSAARDPAHGLLASNFGRDWADDYVHDVLFPLSRTPIL